MSWDASAMIAGLQVAGEELHRKALRAVLAAAEHVLGEAIAIVPLDDGPLQNSGMTLVIDEGGRIVGLVGFGSGAAAAYAEIQHENLTYVHLNGREAKFLEKALHRNASEVGRILARELSR